ncbi:MAG: hypothetical protein JWQ23_4238 [Herminiimonas sp.]|nr:hypothetical protein [Herminiimonas sp.]
MNSQSTGSLPVGMRAAGVGAETDPPVPVASPAISSPCARLDRSPVPPNLTSAPARPQSLFGQNPPHRQTEKLPGASAPQLSAVRRQAPQPEADQDIAGGTGLSRDAASVRPRRPPKRPLPQNRAAQEFPELGVKGLFGTGPRQHADISDSGLCGLIDGYESIKGSLEAFHATIAEIHAQTSDHLEKMRPLVYDVRTIRDTFGGDPGVAFHAAGRVKRASIPLTDWLKGISHHQGALAVARENMEGTVSIMKKHSSHLNALLIDMQAFVPAASGRRAVGGQTGRAPLLAEEVTAGDQARHKRQRSNDTVEGNTRKKSKGAGLRLRSKSRTMPIAEPEQVISPAQSASPRPRAISFAVPEQRMLAREHSSAYGERHPGSEQSRKKISRTVSEMTITFGPRIAPWTPPGLPGSPLRQGNQPGEPLLPSGLSLIDEVEKTLLTPRGETSGENTAQDRFVRTGD